MFLSLRPFLTFVSSLSHRSISRRDSARRNRVLSSVSRAIHRPWYSSFHAETGNVVKDEDDGDADEGGPLVGYNFLTLSMEMEARHEGLLRARLYERSRPERENQSSFHAEAPPAVTTRSFKFPSAPPPLPLPPPSLMAPLGDWEADIDSGEEGLRSAVLRVIQAATS